MVDDGFRGVRDVRSYLRIVLRRESLQSLKRSVRILQVHRVDGVIGLRVIKRRPIDAVVVILVRGVAFADSRRHRVRCVEVPQTCEIVRSNVRQEPRVVPRIEGLPRPLQIRILHLTIVPFLLPGPSRPLYPPLVISPSPSFLFYSPNVRIGSYVWQTISRADDPALARIRVPSCQRIGRLSPLSPYSSERRRNALLIIS